MAIARRTTFVDVYSQGTWLGTAGARGPLLSDYPDDSADYVENNTAVGRVQLNFDAFVLPGGATDIVVRLRFIARRQDAAVQLFGGVTVNGPLYYGAAHDLTTDFEEYVETWSINPFTGAAWTTAQLNHQSVFRYAWLKTENGGSGYKAQIASMQLEVEFTPPPAHSGPREVFKATSTGESTTTAEDGGAGFQNKVSVAIDYTATGRYLVLYSALVAQTDGANQVRARLQLDHGGGFTVNRALSEIRPKDTANWYSAHGAALVEVNGSGTVNARVQFCRNDSGAGTAKIKEARIVAIRLSPYDFAAMNEGASAGATGYEQLATMAVEPVTEGDYLVGAFAVVQPDDETYRAGIRAVLPGGTAFGEVYGILSLDGAERHPLALMTSATLAEGPAEIALQGKIENAASYAEISDMTIFALRLDEFGDNAWTADTSEQGGVVGTSYVAVESITPTLFAGDYIGLFGATIRNMWNSHDQYVEVRAGSAATQAAAQTEGRDNSSPYAHHSEFFLWFGDDQPAGPKTFEIRHKTEHSSQTIFTRDARIAFLGWDVISAEPVVVEGVLGGAGGAGLAGDIGAGVALAAQIGASEGEGFTGDLTLGQRFGALLGLASGTGLSGAAAVGRLLDLLLGNGGGEGFAGAVAAGIRPDGAPGEAEGAGLAGDGIIGLLLAAGLGAAEGTGLDGAASAGALVTLQMGAGTGEGFGGDVALGMAPIGGIGAADGSGLAGDRIIGLMLLAGLGEAGGEGFVADLEGPAIILPLGTARGAGFAPALALGISLAGLPGAAQGDGLAGEAMIGLLLPAGLGDASGQGLPGEVLIALRPIGGLGFAGGAGLDGAFHVGLVLALPIGAAGGQGLPGAVPESSIIQGLLGAAHGEGFAGVIFARLFLPARFPTPPKRRRSFDA